MKLAHCMTRAPLALCALTLALSACDARQTGELSQIVFAYTSYDDTANFNKPIAVGASLDLRALELGSDEEVRLELAQAQPPLVVEGVAAHTVQLKATQAGKALVKVKGRTQDGRVLQDQITLRAAPIAAIALAHGCTDQNHAVYQAGLSDVAVPMTRYAANRELLVGYGVFPVTLEPEGSATVDTRSEDGHALHLSLAKRAARFELVSALGPERLSFELVEQAAIDGLRLDELDQGARTSVGQTMWLQLQPTYKGQPLCQHQTPIEAKSLTPERCDVTTILDQHQRQDGSHAQNTEGVVKVRGKSFGICRVEAWLPGAAASARFVGQFEVGQFPSDLRQDVRDVYDPADPDAATLAMDPEDPPAEDPLALGVPRLSAHQPGPRPLWLAPLLALCAPLLLGPGLWGLMRRRRRR